MDTLNKLYASEINCSISSNWDAGWTFKLGDSYNGFEAQATFDNDKFAEGLEWLKAEAIKRYPDSNFSKEEG